MVKIPTTMRPGVFVHTSVQPVFSSAGTRSGVAAVAQAGSGTAGEVVKISTLSQASVFGVDSVLYSMVKTLLDAQTMPVYAIAAGNDYVAAFAACEPLVDVCAIVSDGGADALSKYISTSGDQGKEQIGILAVSGVSAACQAAKALNNAHVVVVCDGGTKTAVTAAAFAVVLADCGADASLNGAVIPFDGSFDGALTTAEIQTLLQSGVTPFERCGDAVECVRAVTSCTLVDGVTDRTFANLSTVLAIDDVIGSVRHAVKSRLKGLKNNAATRESIASQITIELEAKRALGIIDSYRAPVVAVHPQDPGICVATLMFRVAPEINQIVISTEIQV
ncbi:hypothetical protein V6615_05675 [Oscillospiraceae bacterium PP1C4]